MSATEPLVMLNGGLTVPTEAFTVAHGLMNRGFDLKVEGDRLRVVGIGGAKPDLSAEDVERIKRWKFHLIALVSYDPPKPAWA